MSSEFPYTNFDPSDYDKDGPSSQSAPTVSLPTSPSRGKSAGSPIIADDLQRLRDILFGNQSRTVQQRLNDVDNRLLSTRREFSDLFNQKVDTLEASFSTSFNSMRSELSSRLDEQQSEQTTSLRMMEQSLTERLDQQEIEQKSEWRNLQKEVNEGVEQLAEDFFTQLRNVQRELSERLEQLNTEQAERTRSLSNEGRKQNNDLRKELLSLAASLQDSKISRHELGQQLLELGQRLRSNPHTMR